MCGSSSLVRLKKKEGKLRLLLLLPIFFFCYEVFTKQKKKKESSNHYLPIIVAHALSVHAIYRSDHRSIPIPARTNVHSFKPVVQSPEPTPATTTCPDTNTSRTDARTRLAVENATYFARILHLIPQVYASASLSRFWLIASPPILCTTPAYMCLCSC